MNTGPLVSGASDQYQGLEFQGGSRRLRLGRKKRLGVSRKPGSQVARPQRQYSGVATEDKE